MTGSNIVRNFSDPYMYVITIMIPKELVLRTRDIKRTDLPPIMFVITHTPSNHNIHGAIIFKMKGFITEPTVINSRIQSANLKLLLISARFVSKEVLFSKC